jgi:hypothetical protein
MSTFGFATLSLHGDENHSTTDVACPLHVSTTFQYPEGYNENAAIARGWLPESARIDTGSFHIYSRDTSETRNRVEKVLGCLEKDGMACFIISAFTNSSICCYLFFWIGSDFCSFSILSTKGSLTISKLIADDCISKGRLSWISWVSCRL